MKKILLSWCLFFSYVVMSYSVFGSTTLPDQAVDIKADDINIQLSLHKIIYKGHVFLKQGDTEIFAHRAITYGNEKNQLKKAMIYGQKDEQVHIKTRPSKDKPELDIFADNVHYYPEKKYLELIGHAKLIQGKNQLFAPKIVYYPETKKIITVRTSDPERTHIVFYPEKKNEHT